MKTLTLTSQYKIQRIVFLMTLMLLAGIVLAPNSWAAGGPEQGTSMEQTKQKLAYIVSDLRIPFWDIMDRGIKFSAKTLGYEVHTYSAENNAKKELEIVADAIREKVSGIIVSPTNSSACVTILKLANSAGIPVVISDFGTDGGEYVSYISSNNQDGAYR